MAFKAKSEALKATRLSRRGRLYRLAAISVSAMLFVGACGASSTASPSPATPAPGSPSPQASAAEPTSAPSADGPVVGNGKKQFAWAIGLNELPIIIQMKKEITAYAAERGWEVLYDSGTAGEIQPMINSIQAWITAGVPSITVAPFEPSAFEPLAKQAIEKGLIWIAYGPPMETKHAYIVFPPCDAAVMVADATIKWINENNPTAEVFITSNQANPAVKCKWEDVQKRIEAETDATVVAVQEGNNTVQAFEATQTTLRAHPNVSVVVGTNDDAAVGAAQAFKAAGRDPDEVFIVGFDGSQEALEQIRDGGYIKGTAALNLKRLADKLAEVNIRLAMSGQPTGEPENVVEPPVMVLRGDPLIDEILQFYGD